MTKKLILQAFIGGAIGAVLSSSNITVITWQFWALSILIALFALNLACCRDFLE